MKRKLFFHLGGVFLFSFLFIFAYWAGLPTDFNADHISTNVVGAQGISYGGFLRLILNPLTPAWFYPPEGLMEYLRPLQFIWMKIYFELFGTSLVPFHVTSALGMGLLAMLLFLLIAHWTRSILFGWLAILLYASFPSNYFMLTSTFSGDFQYYVSILSVTALLLCSRLSFGIFKRLAPFLGATACWIVTVWLAIKLKSSEKVIPFVCLAFGIFRFRCVRSRIGFGRFALLGLAILAMMFLVVPLKPFKLWVHEYHASYPQSGLKARMPAQTEAVITPKDKTTFSFHGVNLLQRTFFVPGGEFPFTTVYRREIPKSFSENYGCFLGWFFWLGLMIVPLILARRNRPGQAVDEMIPYDGLAAHDFWMIAIWFAVTIAGFANGLSVFDTRFLNFAYVPSVLLLFLMAGILETRFFRTPDKRFYFRMILSALTVYTVLTNLVFYTKLTAHFGGMQSALVRAEKDVFESFFGREPQDWQLYEKHQEIEGRLCVIDWYDLPQNWFDQAMGKLDREKMIYFYTRTPDSDRLKKLQEAGLRVSLWKRYDFLDAEPWVFKCFKAIDQIKKALHRRTKKQEVLIYRVLPAPQPPSS